MLNLLICSFIHIAMFDSMIHSWTQVGWANDSVIHS